MTKIQWDQAGTRTFETGCDRGVLYLSDGSAVPWNGLTSVTDDLSDVSIEEFYLDGVKYLNRRIIGDYAGTLKAITYPDEFEQFDGVKYLDTGIGVTEQPVNDTFGLTYRTRLGNDLEGVDYGYKIHLLYNLTAKPDSRTFDTMGSSVTPQEFGWTISGIPIVIPGMRPSVHLIINSPLIDDLSMQRIEDYLYGTDDNVPALPDADTLLTFQIDYITDLITEPL